MSLDIRNLGSLSETKIEGFQRLQNRAFNKIDSFRFEDLWERRVLNVHQLMNLDRSLMAYNIMKNLCPEILRNKFQERSLISKYNKRNIRDLHPQRLIVECVKKSLFDIGARALDSITRSIKDRRSIVA